MLVARLDTTYRADAYVIDDIVGFSVAVVVELRSAVSRSCGYAHGTTSAVGERRAHAGVELT